MAEKMEFDKPFKTYDEMLDILSERNVIISDRDFAKKCLSDVSYYALINGYKEILPQENDKFLFFVTFEELYYFHLIDTRLNNIIFRYIIDIEHSLKSKLSYLISEQYGVFTDIDDMTNSNADDYLCKNNYMNNRYRDTTLREIKETTIKNKRKLPSIKHYSTNHNHLPCWILINGIPFGLSIKWYQILKADDKNNICTSLIHNDSLNIDEKKEFLKDALDILRAYRNNIAHGHRSFTNSISVKLRKNISMKISNGAITRSDYTSGLGKNDLFAVILIISALTRDTIHESFIQDIKQFFSEIQNMSIGSITYFEAFSLPEDILTKLENLQ